MTRYASQCLDCVEALHKKGILHGDLRALNFIIDKNKVYIIDFGLSKILDQNDPESKELLNEEMSLIKKEFNRWETPKKQTKACDDNEFLMPTV